MVNASQFNDFLASSPNFRECTWTTVGDTKAHIFRYGLWKFDSRTKAHNEVQGRKRSTSFADSDCRYKASTANEIPHLGDEAFAVPCTYKKYMGLHTDIDHIYEVGGGTLIVRTHNAAIQVWWVKADYPSSETQKDPHWLRGGNQLAYKQALPQMLQVAKVVLTHFPST